jgi:hypothetical protein
MLVVYGFTLTTLFIIKYEKITHFDVFLVLLGPIISRFFACSTEEKNKQKQQRVLALVLSLWLLLLGYAAKLETLWNVDR